MRRSPARLMSLSRSFGNRVSIAGTWSQATEAHVFALKAGAIWPPAIDGLLVLSGLGSIVAGRPFIGAGILLLEMIAIAVTRWLRTPQPEKEATQDSEASGDDDGEMPT